MMKDFSRYALAWILLPVLAIRHKLCGISHYEIVGERGKKIKRDTYPEANEAFNLLVEYDKYGEHLTLNEVKHNGKVKRCRWIEW